MVRPQSFQAGPLPLADEDDGVLVARKRADGSDLYIWLTPDQLDGDEGEMALTGEDKVLFGTDKPEESEARAAR